VSTARTATGGPDGGLVSVVIPVYNGERFLKQAIDSVLRQTYSPVECIVVDDGSTDGSRSVAEAYGPAVRLVAQDNSGVSAARNEGAAQARGEFVAFLDADDVWLPHKLELQMQTMRARPEVGLVYCGMSETDEDLNVARVLGVPSEDHALVDALLLESPTMGIAQTALIPLEVFDRVEGFDTRLSTSADTDLGCRIARAHPVAAVGEPLVLYRQHRGQMHLDAALTERDMVRVYEGFFDATLDPSLMSLRGRAYASLFTTVGLAHLKARRYGRGIGSLLKASRSHPGRTARLLGRFLQRRFLRYSKECRATGRGHILLLTPGFTEPGGAQTHSRLIASGLVSRGWNVSVITRAGTLKRFHYRREARLRTLEVPGWKLGSLGGVIYLGVALAVGVFWGRKARAFLSVQLLSQTTAACTLAAFWRRPFLCFSTTSGDLSEISYIRRSRFRSVRSRILRRAARVVAQTPTAAEELVESVPRVKVEVLPNPVAPTDAPELTGTPGALFCGRLAAEKGILTLLESWKGVVESIPDAKLVIAGTGGDYRSVESEVRAVISGDPMLKASVLLPGWVENPGEWFDRHDVFVLPSTTEGLSNSLLEACAKGRVVVASNIAPNRFVLGDDYPLLFRAGDPVGLRDALTKAFSDEDVRREAAAAVLVNSARFSLEGFLDGCERLIMDAARSTRN
jgi:glycosyltransferase involved in cell wall biosynthesis